ncbi:MAG TPA: YjfB family protein [Noviherbaspirillum sp.]|uniref:YjfB family protein n=1 Tax=Noviherbaspirillum sp. TaxID=1926288 RepID=UPI002D46F5EC|nr:YjfB family protein [Noviherbaspirillum sp.]HYD97332.1 YjfB family protein [Noviherbaspirillum sp.]
MEVKTIANLATTIATTATNQAVGVAVLKKAMDVQASSAAAMLEALPPATGVNNPPHLGQNIDITA